MQPTYLRRHAPFWISIFIGIFLREAAGRSTSAAFVVPFTETVLRLWQLVVAGDFIPQLMDSAKLFLTGFVAAVAVGAPVGMLLARVRALRVASNPTS